MPSFDYKCSNCGFIKEFTHRISESPEYKCPSCGIILEKQFSLNTTGFILKGGTAAINYKEKRHQIKQGEELRKRQQERYGSGPKVRPNVAGMEVDSWSDAKKVAKEAGLNHESYTPFAEKEKKKIIV